MDNENDGLINNHFSIDKHKLPICEYQNATKNLIKKEDIFILVGTTGSGKTTQVPQWSLDVLSQHWPSCKPYSLLHLPFFYSILFWFFLSLLKLMN